MAKVLFITVIAYAFLSITIINAFHTHNIRQSSRSSVTNLSMAAKKKVISYNYFNYMNILYYIIINRS